MILPYRELNRVPDWASRLPDSELDFWYFTANELLFWYKTCVHRGVESSVFRGLR
jgi:hypothetical protein